MFSSRVHNLFLHGFLQLVEASSFQGRYGQRVGLRELIAGRENRNYFYFFNSEKLNGVLAQPPSHSTGNMGH